MVRGALVLLIGRQVVCAGLQGCGHFHLTGDEDEILARARSIPLRWDGTVEDLPAGIDRAIARGFGEGGANVLCGLVILVPRDTQGQGVSAAAVRRWATSPAATACTR
jgi:hypothetical protein